MTRFFKSSFGAAVIPEPVEKLTDWLGGASLLPNWYPGGADMFEDEVLAMGVVLLRTGIVPQKLKDGGFLTFAEEDEPNGWLAWKLNGVALCPTDWANKFWPTSNNIHMKQLR